MCRYGVYVCTTAEREYALEAWRLLDSAPAELAGDPPILDPEAVPNRVICVRSGKKKNLMEVLLPGTYNGGRIRDRRSPA